MDLEVRWSPEATEDVEAIAELSCTHLNIFRIVVKNVCYKYI